MRADNRGWHKEPAPHKE